MDELKAMSVKVRENVVTTIGTFGVGHIGGSLSIVASTSMPCSHSAILSNSAPNGPHPPALSEQSR